MSRKKFVDHILGADSDSRIMLHIECPSCRKEHHVALTRLEGRFAATCGDTFMGGKVSGNWIDIRERGWTTATCQTNSLS